MFYEWLYPLREHVEFLSVFQYITFRTALAALIAFVCVLRLGPRFIAALQRRQILEKASQSDFADLTRHIEENAKDKLETPTMGGLLILGAFLVATALCGNWTNLYVRLALFVVLGFGVMGLLDDVKKLIGAKGLSRTAKMMALTAVAAVALGFITWFALTTDRKVLLSLHVPVGGVALLDATTLGFGGIALILGFQWFVLVGAANAVNITDGLDGLATGCSLISVAAVSSFCYTAGHYSFAGYLGVPFVQGASELTVLGGALMGALLGFLWFNAHPAQIFMGDTGSLAIGGFLGLAAIVSRQELILPIVTAVFVIEAGSSWIQIYSYKLFRKRPFEVAPIHHIWQRRGMPESKLVVRFWIVGAVSAVFGLLLLKLS